MYNTKTLKAYSLDDAVTIPEGTDLDSYTTPGNYISRTSTVTASLKNCPFDNTAFMMHVERIHGTIAGRVKQKIIPHKVSAIEYWRSKTADEEWGEWELLLTSANIQSGKSSDYISCPANQITEHHFDFPSVFFDIPIVVACIYSKADVVDYADLQITVFNITKTGFDVRIYNKTTMVLNPGIRWIAHSNNTYI